MNETSTMNHADCICELSDDQLNEVSGGVWPAIALGVGIAVGLYTLGTGAYKAGRYIGSHLK